MAKSDVEYPYLGVLSEFEAATTPAPTHRPGPSALLVRVLGKAAFPHRQRHAGSRRVSVDHGDNHSSVVEKQRPGGSSQAGPAVRQGKAPHPIHTTTR